MTGPGDQALIVTAGTRACAIPARDVVETMRPLPIEPIAGMPGLVRGLSVVRGVPIPVIDLAALLEAGDCPETYARFVTMRIGERRAVVAVQGVVGLRNLDMTELRELPPLLQGSESPLIQAIGGRDAQLLIVLRAARMVPDEIWTAPELSGGAR